MCFCISIIQLAVSVNGSSEYNVKQNNLIFRKTLWCTKRIRAFPLLFVG